MYEEQGSGVWRNLYHEELHDLHSSPTILRVIKSRIIRLAGHIAGVGERRVQGFCEET
jgi:hypothetical protein